MKSLALVFLASVAAVPLVHAADLPMPSRIDAVTVFPDAAAVTRVGEVSVPQGQHVILLRGLPATIDPGSIRVEGTGDGQLQIGSADIRRVPAETVPNEDAQKKLRELRLEMAKVRGRMDAIEAQKKAVTDFSRIAAEASAKDGKGFDIAQARAAWAAVGEGIAAANEAAQGEAARLADIEAEIRAVEAASGRQRPSLAPVVDVAISVEAARDMGAAFKVTYRVAGARWLAVYDAQLDTVANGPVAKVNLVRRASVTQRTGEDWSDVELTLSTARVAGGATVPDVRTQALGLRDPAVVFELDQRRQRQAAPSAARPAPPSLAAEPIQQMEAAKATEQEASAAATAFSASFMAPGRVSISRDGSQRTLRLSSHVIDAPLLAKIAPALETRAYLSTNLTWSDDVPLLPGEVSLTRDGMFVGKARIEAVAPGDQFDLGFGADDRIKVERLPVRRRDNDPSGWSASRNQISDHRTIITNLHRRPMRISLTDRIPVSENSAITIEPLATNTVPTEKIVQERRGVMGWTHDYAPSEKREVRLGWRLRWPADRELVGQ